MSTIVQSSAAAVDPRPLGPGFVLTAVAGALCSAAAVAIVAANDSLDDRGLIAASRALVIAVPVAVGLWGWHRRPDDRFSRLLAWAGVLWFLTTLAESSDEVLYSVGRIGVWLVEPVVLAVALAFPWGRLRTRAERTMVRAAVALVAVLYLPTALLVERYPEPSYWASCGTDCPANAFMVTASEPAFVEGWVRPVREVVTTIIFASVVVFLAGRIRGATPIMRRTLWPVLGVAIVRSGFLIAGVVARRYSAPTEVIDVLGWLYVLCLPALAVAFFVGLLRSRLFFGDALQRLAARLADQPGAGELRSVLAQTMGDPSLELAYWVPGPPGEWVDDRGRPLELPAANADRRVVEVRDDDRLVAAIILDAALAEEEQFVEAAGSYALAGLARQRLAVQLESSLADLRESRARIAAAADEERRRIERDLHDGAQQRLVALRIRLGLATELMADDPRRAARIMRELGDEAEDALEEVRTLAGGIYPARLASDGVGEAVRAIARRTAPGARVVVADVGRLPAEVETAVYFCCAEAMQNVTKHAGEASSLLISVTREDDAVRFEVRDDGRGFTPDEAAHGSGLVNMRDRLAAVGGTLIVESRPGAGTRVCGLVPLARRAAGGSAEHAGAA